MGEMLAQTERAKGKRTDLVTLSNQVDKPTLSDLGLTKRESAEAQRAVVASRLANMGHGGDRKSNQVANLPLENISQPEAAEMLNVSERIWRRIRGQP
jgi:hypothetical protein